MKSKILKSTVATLVSFALFIPAVLADFLPVQVYATDTVAGYPSAFRTSLIDPNQDVKFVVEKPDRAVVQIPAQANLEGIAKTDFYGHQTKIAGTYRVSVVFPGSPTSSPQSTFRVYPDQVSPTQSTLRSTEQMVEADGDVTFHIITLYDQYRNPVPNHHINLISSRSEDTIEALQGGVTDQNGRANFKVRSRYSGISVFTAVDTTVNQILSDREEIVFFQPTTSQVAESPFLDLLLADIGGDDEVLPGPVDHFELQGLPSTARVGEELSMTIVAKDKSDNTAKNYTGTVLISVVPDENATLPNNGEYTFKAADQGKFTFDLSLSFTQLGEQTVQVLDKNNFSFSGEHQIEIVPTGAVFPAPTSSTLSIKSPADGAELGSNLVIITGTGNENINLSVFDNDTKIGDTETDGDGFFSLEAKNLESGPHTFYVMDSSAGEVSKAVTILIDTLAPVLNSFEMDAEGSVVPGTQVTITVTSEPGLEEAKVRLQGVEEPMSETDPGTYEVMVVSPVQDGQFPVDVILIDGLANKGEFLNKGTIEVSTPKPTNPPQAEGLEGTPGDTVISLTWQPVEDHEREIQKYRVYYGTTLDNLENTVDTLTSSPQWELRELTNDTQYFIAVKAVDSQGLESEEMSVTIAATPVAPDPCQNVECGEYGQCVEGACECEENWSGDQCDQPIVGNLGRAECLALAGYDWCELPQRCVEPDETCSVIPVTTQMQATPYDSAVMLSWPAFPGVQAYYYKVFIGYAPGHYIDHVVTPDNRTTATVMDLINNAPYYFAVAALDINGQVISPMSAEVQAVPTGAGFRPAAPSPVPYDIGAAPSPVQPGPVYPDQLGRIPRTDETGPEAIWIILASVAFAHFLYHHKKKVVLRQSVK